EEVLGLDVRRTGGACHLEGVEERAVDGQGHHGPLDVGTPGCRGQTVFGGGGDGTGIGADALDRRRDGVVRGEDVEDVQRVELPLTATQREGTRTLQDALRPGAEEAREVDRALLPRALTGEVAREELVERARTVGGGDVFRHPSLQT